MITVPKRCRRCHSVKPLSEFYIRSGRDKTSEVPGHYVSECKDCMLLRNKTHSPLSPYEPRVLTEKVAIDQLLSVGIHAIPGKAIHAADVDVVCWGCVWLEVKHCRLDRKFFRFLTTPKQQKRGFLADLVMLICEYPEYCTFHVFEVNHPVFYINGRIKSALNFTPGAMEAKKHANTRVVMTQPIMDEHEDRWDLIEQYRLANPRRHLDYLNK